MAGLSGKLLAPIRRWASSTASGTCASNAIAAGGAHGLVGGLGLAQRARSARPRAASAAGALWPIGSCHGLNSPHSPRIVTSIRSGRRQVWFSASMLMQLPTPLRLHQQHAALAAEPGAGEQADALLLGGQHHASSSPDRPGRARSGARGRHPARRRPGARRARRAPDGSPPASCSPLLRPPHRSANLAGGRPVRQARGRRPRRRPEPSGGRAVGSAPRRRLASAAGLEGESPMTLSRLLAGVALVGADGPAGPRAEPGTSRSSRSRRPRRDRSSSPSRTWSSRPRRRGRRQGRGRARRARAAAGRRATRSSSSASAWSRTTARPTSSWPRSREQKGIELPQELPEEAQQLLRRAAAEVRRRSSTRPTWTRWSRTTRRRSTLFEQQARLRRRTPSCGSFAERDPAGPAGAPRDGAADAGAGDRGGAERGAAGDQRRDGGRQRAAAGPAGAQRQAPGGQRCRPRT